MRAIRGTSTNKMFGIQGFCSSSEEPPFQNDFKFLQQIEMWIQPNRYFPYVQLQQLKITDLGNAAKLGKDSARSDPPFARNIKMCNRRRKRSQSRRRKPYNLTQRFSCTRCSLTFKTKQQRFVHEHIHGDTFRCEFCRIGYKTVNGLTSHMKIMHPDARNKSCKVIKDPNVIRRPRIRKLHNLVKNFSCSKCPIMFNRRNSRDKHETIHGDTFCCEFCSVGFKQYGGLALHIKRIHPDEQNQSSEVIEEPDGNISQEEISIKDNQSQKHNKSKKTICHICKRIFAKTYMDRHLALSHRRRKDCICIICDKSLSTPSWLKYHLIARHSDHEVVRSDPLFGHNVEICKRQRQRERNWKSVKSRNSLVQFSCSQCSLMFKDKRNRDKHENIHGDTFCCEFCSVGFKRAKGLTLHMKRIHPDERNQSSKDIEDTNENTTQEGISIDSIQIQNQSKSKTKTCPIGSRSFAKSSYLKRHWALIHSGRRKSTVLCSYCEKSFSSKWLLNYHVMARHSNHEIVRSDPLFANNFEMYKREQQRKRNWKSRNSIVQFSCSQCSLMFKDKHDRDRHENIHGDAFRCELCSVGFKRAKGLTLHMQRVHPDKRNQSSENIEDTVANRRQRNWSFHNYAQKFSCSKCSAIFKDKHNLDRHENTHGDTFPCEFCSVGYKQARGLALHMKRKHPDQQNKSSEVIEGTDGNRIQLLLQKFNCSKCSAIFKDKHHRDKHESINGDTFCCQFCSVGFKLRQGLTLHMKRKHPDNTDGDKSKRNWKFNFFITKFSCSICSLIFKRKLLLDRHENTHGDTFRCEFCSVGFKQARGLALHMKRKHPDQQNKSSEVIAVRAIRSVDFQCPHCPKNLSSQYILNRHLKLHDMENLHVCDDCGFRYATSDGLQRHKSFCNSDKQSSRQLKCPHLHCHSSHKSAKNLSTHIRKFHRTERERLKKSLETNSGVNVNSGSVTGAAQFNCTSCGINFSVLADFVKHVEVECSSPEIGGLPIPDQFPIEKLQIKYNHKKKFSCSKCSQMFKRRLHRDRHENIHGDTFCCQFCSVGFKLRQGLTLHMKCMHPDKLNQSTKVMEEASKTENDITITDIKIEHMESPPSNAIKAEDPISSWVRSISQDSSGPSPLVVDCSVPNIIPTTVLKMEY